MTLLAVLVLLVVAVLLVIRFGLSELFEVDRRHRPLKTLERHWDQIRALSVEQARRKVKALFEQHPAILVTPAKTPADLPELAPGLRTFFSEIADVDLEFDEAYLFRDDIAPYDRNTAFIRLGQDGPHHPLVTRPNDERVYVLAEDAAAGQEVETEYPSLYHWILAVSREIDVKQLPDV
ncbi:MAG: hypothetical protein HY343_02795 [Lentisphaerae bacterium]|nr:hypothetical protein [Lentisphaerota bacterium]